MTNPTGHQSTPTCRRLALTLALAGTATILGPAAANATPANPAATPTPEIPRNMPQIVSDVLGPADPAFWNPAVPGTRVLTPIEPDVEVACATGFVPVISCSTLDRSPFGTPQRTLEHVDVPVLGGPPLRVWFDVPRLGDGSTQEPVERLVTWWLTNPTPS